VLTYGMPRAKLAADAAVDVHTLRRFMQSPDAKVDAQILNRLWASASYHLEQYQKRINETPVPRKHQARLRYIRLLEAGLPTSLAMQRYRDARAGGRAFQRAVGNLALKKAFLFDHRELVKSKGLRFPDNLHMIGWRTLLRDYETQPETTLLIPPARNSPNI